jgi:hypothetical protein
MRVLRRGIPAHSGYYRNALPLTDYCVSTRYQLSCSRARDALPRTASQPAMQRAPDSRSWEPVLCFPAPFSIKHQSSLPFFEAFVGRTTDTLVTLVYGADAIVSERVIVATASLSLHLFECRLAAPRLGGFRFGAGICCCVSGTGGVTPRRS